MASRAKQLMERLIPPARRQMIVIEEKRRNVVWGNTQLTLRVREYPKSKNERVSLVMPNFHRVRLWSEALRRKVQLDMTRDTLRMIEDMGGLDAYLLQTPESKLKSDVASALKWEVITAVRRRHHQLAQMQGSGEQASP